jgi:hypothetical protein
MGLSQNVARKAYDEAKAIRKPERTSGPCVRRVREDLREALAKAEASAVVLRKDPE